MPVSTELLEILVCPETKQPVALATAERLEELNQKIRKGELRNRSGETVEKELTEALVREDERVLYPVDDFRGRRYWANSRRFRSLTYSARAGSEATISAIWPSNSAAARCSGPSSTRKSRTWVNLLTRARTPRELGVAAM